MHLLLLFFFKSSLPFLPLTPFPNLRRCRNLKRNRRQRRRQRERAQELALRIENARERREREGWKSYKTDQPRGFQEATEQDNAVEAVRRMHAQNIGRQGQGRSAPSRSR